MEVYQLAVSRVEILVKETESLRLHIAALKSRLQRASLHKSNLTNGKSAFQVIFIISVWLLTQHLASCYIVSVGKYSNIYL